MQQDNWKIDERDEGLMKQIYEELYANRHIIVKAGSKLDRVISYSWTICLSGNEMTLSIFMGHRQTMRTTVLTFGHVPMWN